MQHHRDAEPEPRIDVRRSCLFLLGSRMSDGPGQRLLNVALPLEDFEGPNRHLITGLSKITFADTGSMKGIGGNGAARRTARRAAPVELGETRRLHDPRTVDQPAVGGDDEDTMVSPCSRRSASCLGEIEDLLHALLDSST